MYSILNGNTLIVVVYVDDLVITGNNIDLILRLKKQLVDSFDMTDLGTLHYFLGLQVLPLCDGFFISQSKYVMDLLTHFKMEYCKPCATPFQSGVKLTKTCQTPKVDATLYRQLVDSLIYLTHSRPDISFVVSVVSQVYAGPQRKPLERSQMNCSTISRVPLILVSSIVEVQIHWSASPTPTGLATMMIKVHFWLCVSLQHWTIGLVMQETKGSLLVDYKSRISWHHSCRYRSSMDSPTSG
jgi:hypothetical protein